MNEYERQRKLNDMLFVVCLLNLAAAAVNVFIIIANSNIQSNQKIEKEIRIVILVFLSLLNKARIYSDPSRKKQ